MPLSICDVTFYWQLAAIGLSVVSLLLAWFDKQKWSIVAMAFSIFCLTYVTLRPPCAKIIDLRGVPGVGAPPFPK